MNLKEKIDNEIDLCSKRYSDGISFSNVYWFMLIHELDFLAYKYIKLKKENPNLHKYYSESIYNMFTKKEKELKDKTNTK